MQKKTNKQKKQEQEKKQAIEHFIEYIGSCSSHIGLFKHSYIPKRFLWEPIQDNVQDDPGWSKRGSKDNKLLSQVADGWNPNPSGHTDRLMTLELSSPSYMKNYSFTLEAIRSI